MTRVSDFVLRIWDFERHAHRAHIMGPITRSIRPMAWWINDRSPTQTMRPTL